MSTAKQGRPFSDKPADITRDKIRNVLGKASVSTGMGKLPPQAVDLEEAVLGALMLEKDALTTVIEILQIESFYKESHQKIYEAILQLFDNSEPVDILTVTNQLRKNGTLEFAGGPYYISGLTQRVNSAANVEYHARIVSEKAIKRHLITIASEIEREAYEDTTDTFALLDKVEQDIFNVSEVNIRKNYSDMRSMMREAINELEAKKQHKDGLTGVPTGFTHLDRITSGWQKSDLVIIAARPAMGKCLGKGTKVLMYDGSLKKVEDVRVGDQLMGDDSTPRRVASLARGKERMYWVRQNRGMDYRVNESHILSLKRSRTEGPHRNGDVLNISVRDYLTKAPKFKSNYKGYKVAVEFAEKQLSVDPYFIGLWLGDGDRNSPRITTNDSEVVSSLEKYADRLSQAGKLATLSTYDGTHRCGQYAITKGYRGGEYEFSIKDELRRLNLLGNKHIPQDYLLNSTRHRLALLAGLIDSEGHYLVQSNGYEITQKNELLAHQIKFLCDSLGFRTSIRKKTATISSIGYESEVYRVRFYGDTDRIPVRVSRKKSLPWKSRVDWQMTGISVEYDQVDDYYGFTLDGNHLFLLEDMTVTHNTAFVLSALRNAAVDFGHSVAIFSLEMSSIQLVNRLISAEAELESEKIKKGNLREDEWQQLYAKTSRLTEASIFIDDTPALSIRELRSKCRRLKAQNNIELIIIDYLQLMTGDASRTGGGNREQEIASISRALKNIAKELSVPVIALSQLSRAVETRGGDKRPQLSDLRESGCLTGDALVFNANTGEQIPMAELAQRQHEGQLDGFSALATNPQWKLNEHNVSNAFYSGKKEVFELVTRSGRAIKASGNHPFLKLQGWTPLDELVVGDKVAVPRQLSVSSPTNPMSEDELILLAHLLGDGCILPKQPYHWAALRYTSADPVNIDVVRRTAQRLFNIEGTTVQQSNWWHYYLRCPYHLTHGKKHPITHWYESLGLFRVRSYEKKVPDALFRCDDQRIALFLHHLWATDGNISSTRSVRSQKDSISIYYASSSPQLAQQIQHLLLRLGILSTVRSQPPKKKGKPHYRTMHHVIVYGRDEQLKFLRQVGCYGNRGACIPSLIEVLEEVEANPNFDVIPKEAWQEWIKQYQVLSTMSWRVFAQKMNMQYCGSALFKNGISRSRMERIHQILPFATLKHLAESDVLWDEIVSLRSLGVQDVYDITVDEAHNFVANDIITHNSIEQDADMVMFLYRPEYYGLTEDSEGQPVQGIGEIIISKHRNGALDTVQLKFIGKFTKFTNLTEVTMGNNYGNQLQSASMGEEFNDPGIVTFASKANDRQFKPDEEKDPPDDDPFAGGDAPF